MAPPSPCVIAVAARLASTAGTRTDETGARPRPLTYGEHRNRRHDAPVAG